jgi:hypothetical protein
MKYDYHPAKNINFIHLSLRTKKKILHLNHWRMQIVVGQQKNTQTNSKKWNRTKQVQTNKKRHLREQVLVFFSFFLKNTFFTGKPRLFVTRFFFCSLGTQKNFKVKPLKIDKFQRTYFVAGHFPEWNKNTSWFFFAFCSFLGHHPIPSKCGPLSFKNVKKFLFVICVFFFLSLLVRDQCLFYIFVFLFC